MLLEEGELVLVHLPNQLWCNLSRSARLLFLYPEVVWPQKSELVHLVELLMFPKIKFKKFCKSSFSLNPKVYFIEIIFIQYWFSILSNKIYNIW